MFLKKVSNKKYYVKGYKNFSSFNYILTNTKKSCAKKATKIK